MSGALKIAGIQLPYGLAFGYPKAKGEVALKETCGG